MPTGEAPLTHPEILRLPKRMPVPEVARHLVCSKCGAENSKAYNPIWATPDAQDGGTGSIRTIARAKNLDS